MKSSKIVRAVLAGDPVEPGSEKQSLETRKAAFTAALRQILAQHETVGAGRLQVLTISALRQRLGANWPKFAGRVQDAAHRIIRRHLAAADSVIDVGEGFFIIVYAELSGDSARLRTTLIAQRIVTHLFGEDFEQEPGLRDLVQTRAVSIDLHRELLDTTDDLIDLIDRRFEEVDRQSPAPPDNLPLDENYDRYFDWAGEPDGGQLPDHVVWHFRPLFDVPRRAVTTYACSIASATRTDGQLLDTGWIFSQTEDPRIGHLDAQTLARVAKELHEFSKGRRPFLVACKVHYYTLETRSRRQNYLRQFRYLPEDHRRYLVLELHGLPAGAPTSRAQELVAELRQHARRVTIRVDLNQAMEQRIKSGGLHALKQSGFDAVGVDWSGFDRDEAALRRLLGLLVASADRAGLKTYVLGLRSSALVLAAIDAGCEMIQSDVIMPPVEKPSDMYHIDLELLFPNVPPGSGSASHGA